VKNLSNSRIGVKALKAGGLDSPNPAGRNGKPILLPPTTFEDAVKKMLNTPPPQETSPKKKQSAKKR
jgi:hypothetical protein